MTRATRLVSLAIAALYVAALVFGWMPGLSDDEIRPTIGWVLTISLVGGAAASAFLAWRARPDVTVMWSVVTLTVAGMFAFLAWMFFRFDSPYPAEVLWPRIAFAVAMIGIGVLHAAVVGVAVVAALERRRRRALADEPIPRAVLLD